MPNKPARKLGRPPASRSVDRRRRILDAARQTFAELGWEVTTNNAVAEKADVTGAAIYHYFDSKLDMFRAVHDDVERMVSAEFAEAVAASETFTGQFEAILERAYELNARDPSLARFMASSRVDMNRNPDLRAAIRRWAGDDIVASLVKTGLATGEIPARRKKQVSALVRAILVGLNDAVSDDLSEQRAAIDGARALLEGTLLELPSTNGRRRTPPGR